MRHEVERDVERVVLALDVNGETRDVLVPVHKTLLEVLREDMQLTGTKHGCELGECGTCTVLIDGKPELSCLLLPVQLEGRAITTVEGMSHGPELHPLQVAFGELGAASCSRRNHCSRRIHDPPATRFAMRSRAISAGAPATPRSCRPLNLLPGGCGE